MRTRSLRSYTKAIPTVKEGVKSTNNEKPKNAKPNSRRCKSVLAIHSSEASTKNAGVKKFKEDAPKDIEIINIDDDGIEEPNMNPVDAEAENTELLEDENLPVFGQKEKRLVDILIQYQKHKYLIPPLFQQEWEENDEDRTLIDDTLIEFYMCKFMWNTVYGDVERRRFHVFLTFFYPKLRNCLSSYYTKGAPTRSQLADHYNTLFQNVQPQSILQKEVLVIPIHLNKPRHWFLVLVHSPSGAIRSCTRVDRDQKNMRERSLTAQVNGFAHFGKTAQCRIMIMDSLFSNRKYRKELDNAYALAFDYIRLWLQMAAAACGEELMCSRVKKVVCEKLPQQKNSVDCGLYMMCYAEYFTKFNVDWLDKPTNELAYLVVPEEISETLETREPRERLDKTLQKLKFRG